MYIYDVSLNLMSLGGLALGIGMLVDNAVVVLENIQVYIEKGILEKKAVSEGNKRGCVGCHNIHFNYNICIFTDNICGRCCRSDLWRSLFGSCVLTARFFGSGSLFVPMLVSTEFSTAQVTERPSIKERFKAGSLFEMVGKYQWMEENTLVAVVYTKIDIGSVGELTSTFVVVPLVFLLWVFLSVFKRVIPYIAGLLLTIANVFLDDLEKLEGMYSRIFFPLFSKPTIVIATAALIFLGSLPTLFSLGQSFCCLKFIKAVSQRMLPLL